MNPNARFIDSFVSREFRFSLGVEAATGRYFLSTPVSGRMLAAEYEAYFAIDGAEFERFRADPSSAEDFLERCRNHANEDRLVYP